MKIARQSEHEGQFHQLGGLQAENTKINPALRPHPISPAISRPPAGRATGNKMHTPHQKPQIDQRNVIVNTVKRQTE